MPTLPMIWSNGNPKNSNFQVKIVMIFEQKIVIALNYPIIKIYVVQRV